jgi:hypothetical protein
VRSITPHDGPTEQSDEMYNWEVMQEGRSIAQARENKGAEPSVDQSISGVKIGLGKPRHRLHFAIGFFV